MDFPITKSATNPFRAPKPAVVRTNHTDTSEAKATLVSSEKMSSATFAEPGDDDREDDIDFLIDQLDSMDEPQNSQVVDHRMSMESTKRNPTRSEPEFDTDLQSGLTDVEVILRRKKYGANKLKEEKENLCLKFLSFFVGPVQFVMEVCCKSPFALFHLTL